MADLNIKLHLTFTNKHYFISLLHLVLYVVVTVLVVKRY